MRQAKLAELLSADGHTVHTFALEALGPLEGVRQEKYLAEAEFSMGAADSSSPCTVSRDGDTITLEWEDLSLIHIYAWVKDHTVTFLMGIGGALKSGRPHDGRAPDYDDWTLNGDILAWNSVLGRAFELSSMGIRVDAAALDRQLTIAGCDNRRELPFHKLLLEGKLPLTVGGGIGQSRLCMLLLGKAHIGEVQASVWDEQTLQACQDAGVILL